MCTYAQLLSHVQLFATPWTVAYQALLSMRFSRHKYWSGLSSPSPGDLPEPGIEPMSCIGQVDSLPLSCQGRKAIDIIFCLDHFLLVFSAGGACCCPYIMEMAVDYFHSLPPRIC